MDASDLLTTGEAADQFGKTRAAWRQACERGAIPAAMNKGKMWLIPRHAAAAYMASAKRGRPPSEVQSEEAIIKKSTFLKHNIL